MRLFMNFSKAHLARRLALMLLRGTPLLALPVGAQPFLTPSNGDLLAGFRKTGANQANYEVLVNIGNITNLEALAPGAQVSIGKYTPSQLAGAFSDYNNLQWSVFGSFKVFGSWAGFPYTTIWYTLPRVNADTPAQAPGRVPSSGQTQVKQWILSAGYGAAFISSAGVSNSENTASLVREPSGDAQHALSVSIGDPNDATLGDFNGTLNFVVENTTPANFTSAVRSDLYQSCPSGSADPTTQATTGSAYYVGYFQFNANGTLSFTRASNSTVTPLAPPLVSIGRAGNTSTLSFSTTNGATYSVYYTNGSSLAAPLSTWQVLPGTITGDGSVKSVSDASTDADRVYRVAAH